MKLLEFSKQQRSGCMGAYVALSGLLGNNSIENVKTHACFVDPLVVVEDFFETNKPYNYSTYNLNRWIHEGRPSKIILHF